jgi:hypothetical protein
MKRQIKCWGIVLLSFGFVLGPQHDAQRPIVGKKVGTRHIVRSRREPLADPNCTLDYVYVGMMTWGGSDPAIAGQERSIK